MHNLAFAMEGAFKVLIAGLLLGAGMPLMFALGVKSLAMGAGGEAVVGQAQPRPIGKLLAGICFAVVLIGVVLGITFIAASGFGMKMSFEHIYPVLVPKS